MTDGSPETPDKGDRLRIVHCFRSPVGGIFRHVRDLVRQQAADGHSVAIVCDSSTGGPREDELFVEILPYLSLGLHRIPMQREITPVDCVTLTRLFFRIRSLHPDVIHTHGAKGGVYGRIIGTLLRVSGSSVARIYCPHGGSLHYNPHSRQGKVFFALERMMERLTDGFIFVSRYEAEAFAEKVGRPVKPWRVTTNGLQAAEFEPVEPDPDASDFLYIGMMRDLKGPDLFIQALAVLRDCNGKAPSAEMVGDGPDTGRYQALAARLGLDSIRFHPAMPARRAFAAARSVVVPSRAESMPYIVLETIAAGLPLIATRVGGIPEIFGEARESLVPPGDVPALAAAMDQFLRQPETALAEAGALHASVRARFSIEAMASGVSGLYHECLAK